MYRTFEIDFNNTIFEWDDTKELVNFNKHGIHFRTAVKVFLDPNKLVREDDEHGNELRFDVIGSVGKVLFIVCVFKENQTIRLISARLATKKRKREV